MNLKELIKRGESKTLELKEELPSAVNLAKTVVAFSNTAGGKIVIGVNNKREIVGIDTSRIFEIQDQVVSIIYDNCYPIILPEIYTVNIEGKVVLVIEIYRGSQLPYYLKRKGKFRGTYIRVGATNRLADEQILMDLERQRLGKTFDEEENPEVELSQIDLQPIIREFNKIGKKVDIVELKNLRLIKSVHNKDFPTNALLIILGLFDNTTIKCARFKGNSMESFIDKKEFGGDLFSVLESVIAFLKNHLNLKAEIQDFRRIEKYEIPIVALREALLNAIVHRDYTRNSDIKVAIYDDIVEIVSPGGLPDGLTVDDVYNGRSELRNKVIARVFKELGYVETWGSGIKKISEVCKESGVKFELKDEGNFVSVVFYRSLLEGEESGKKRVVVSDYDRLRPITTDYDRLTIEEKEVLLYLLDNKKATRKTVVTLLKVGETKAKEIFKSLLGKGLIERHGKGRSTYYTLKRRPQEKV